MRLMSLVLFGLALSGSAQAQDAHRFVMTGVGRFANFADTASIVATPEGGRIRAFQVVEPDFRAGDRAYWGGWSWWAFDCQAGTMDRLDFAAVRETGEEGPATPDTEPGHVAAQGGDAFELLVAACNPDDYDTDAVTLREAVILGRSNLAAY